MIRIAATLLLMTATTATAQNYEFSNPSFSGNGWSSHVLMLEQMTQSNTKREEERQAAEERERIREEENSNINRFINNFESRVYAELSKILVDKLFGEDPEMSGSFELGGNIIDYVNDGVDVILTITSPDGDVTIISVPVGGLGL